MITDEACRCSVFFAVLAMLGSAAELDAVRVLRFGALVNVESCRGISKPRVYRNSFPSAHAPSRERGVEAQAPKGLFLGHGFWNGNVQHTM